MSAPERAFRQQQRTAKTRGIEWCLTFEEWWKVWQGSGKWAARGRMGYCMARHGDQGPYRADNVYICTMGQNCSDSLKAKPMCLRRERGRGWSYKPNKCGARPYVARYSKTWLGNFATPEQAEAAYVAARDFVRAQAKLGCYSPIHTIRRLRGGQIPAPSDSPVGIVCRGMLIP